MRFTSTGAGFALAACLMSALAGCGSASSPLSPTAVVADPATATSITYSHDVQPLLSSDCTRCHNTTTRNAGYEFTTLAGVLRAVSAGNARSPLVVATQPGGAMYSEWRGSAAQKAEVIRRWVVDFGAVQ